MTVESAAGLHARPAAAFVRTAAGFDAQVTVANVTAGRGPASARSLNAVATLGVRRGDEILVQASGPQAEEALAAIRRLADDDFGEPPEARPQAVAGAAAGRSLQGDAGAASLRGPPPDPGSVLTGFPASPGFAVGAARLLQAAPIEVPDGPSQDRDADLAALERALDATADDVRRARASVAGRARDYDAAIFDAHLLFLEDEALLGPARRGVVRDGKNAARAWADALATAAAAWDALDDPYLRARAADLRAVGDQVLRHLLERRAGVPGVAQARGPRRGRRGHRRGSRPDPRAGRRPRPRTRCSAVACAFGGPTSHGAILARSLGIPAVVGAGRALLGVAEGTLLGARRRGRHGHRGPAGRRRYGERRGSAAGRRREQRPRRERSARARRHARRRARARGGQRGRARRYRRRPWPPAPTASASCAPSSSSWRPTTCPTEDEQETAYREVAEGLGGRPLTLRTLDVGADKPLPYLPLEGERNPNLGLRGIRLSLRHPELLLTQLRAVLRVAADHPLRVMFPMVATVDEVRRARELLAEARESLIAEGVSAPETIEVGIMVEVPAAALMVEAFVPHVDFFSLGTNDLAQYVLAADRGNAAVAGLADALHPAVLRLIDRVARAAAEGGRGVAVCGEMAGDPLAIPLLLGLGIAELSMAAARIPLAKQAVRATDLGGRPAARGPGARRRVGRRRAPAGDPRRVTGAARRTNPRDG